MAGVIEMRPDRRRAVPASRSSSRAPTSSVQSRAEEAFWRSPPGQAVQAYERGDEFFQLRLPHSAVRFDPLGTATRMAGLTGTDLLGQIEEAGWHLEHASWVPDRDGDVDGMYLFRRDEARRQRRD